MRISLRWLLVWILALSLPLQAASAVARATCGLMQGHPTMSSGPSAGKHWSMDAAQSHAPQVSVSQGVSPAGHLHGSDTAVVVQADHDAGHAGHACGICAACCMMQALPCIPPSQQGACHTGTYSLTDAGALPAPAVHRLERPPRRVLV